MRRRRLLRFLCLASSEVQWCRLALVLSEGVRSLRGAEGASKLLKLRRLQRLPTLDLE